MKGAILWQRKVATSAKVRIPRIYSEYKKRLTFEFLFLVIYSIYSFFYVIDDSMVPIAPVMKLIKLATMCMLPMIIFMKRGFELKRVGISVLVAILLVIAARKADKTFLIIYALFLIAAYDIDFNKIIRCSFVTSLSATVLVMAASQIGVVSDRIYYRDGLIAHCMGFSYYSTYPYILLFNMLSFMYLKREKVSYFQLMIFALANYLVFRLSSLRLAFYLGFFCIILYIILVKVTKLNLNKFLIKCGGAAVFPFMFGLTLYSSLHYSNVRPFWRKLNEVLSNRLAMQHEGFRRYAVTLLGQYIQVRALRDNGMISSYYFYIDSGYVFSLLAYGLLCTSVVIMIYSCLTYWACEDNNKQAFIWLVIIAVFSIVNNTWLNLTYNPIIFLLTSKAVKERLPWRSLNGITHPKT